MAKPQRTPLASKEYFLLVTCGTRKIEYTPDGDGLLRIVIVVPSGTQIRASLGNGNGWSAGKKQGGHDRYNKICRLAEFQKALGEALAAVVYPKNQIVVAANISVDLAKIVESCVDSYNRNKVGE